MDPKWIVLGFTLLKSLVKQEEHISILLGPLSLISAMAPTPFGVDLATMVSSRLFTLQK
jgi:hypothetical protein